MELSGKIAGSQINLTNGDVESMLFGDWSLNSTASSISFSATFTMMPLADSSDSNNATEYRIDNLRANTVQQINNIAVFGGRTGVASNGTATFEDISTTIML
jgi:hypothetical protein